jgi:hypothetical protein
VAQTIYEQFATLQWEGENVRVVATMAEPVGLNNLLNLGGGVTAWESMAAIVRTVTEDEGSGEISVNFGPPRHLGARELADLQLFNRWRRTWRNPATISTGESGDGGEIDM